MQETNSPQFLGEASRFATNFAILPHAKAPMFKDGDAEVAIKQVLSILNSPAGVSGPAIIDCIRQASLVNLWFFLKFVASASGPYDFLNEGVHLDLANFRQSEYCMAPGSRAAIFLPRGFAKTTICTTGATAWEARRDPNIRQRIVNAVVTRAHKFKNTARAVFDSNPLMTLIDPACVPGKNPRRWTDSEFCMPNATRFFNEPTVAAGGAGGASEGDHHDILSLDDLIGLDNVDADFNPNQNMESVRSWMDTNMNALLLSVESGRIVLVATRYGRGDVYQQMFDDCKALHGYPEGLPNVRPDPVGGTWDIYYRHVVEHGVATNPYVMTVPKFEKLQKEKPMVAALQYANDVDASINNEFAKLHTKSCRLLVDGEFVVAGTNKESYIKNGRSLQIIKVDVNTGQVDEGVFLSDCSVVLSCDWAGSKKATSRKSSRSSIGLWALDVDGNYYRLAQRVGFFSIDQVFDMLFELHTQFEGYIRNTLVEANAMQLGIVQLLKQEEMRRKHYLALQVVNARGDKQARIRGMLGLPLSQGQIFLAEGSAMEFREEQLTFPMGRLDVLDESAKAFEVLRKPMSRAYKEERRVQDEIRQYNLGEARKPSKFGY